jgi:hypothetical protein
VKTVALFLVCIAPIAAGAQTAAPQKPSAAQTQAPASTTTKPADSAAKDSTAKSASSIDPAKEAAIRKLFEVQGTRNTMQAAIAGMSENMKPMLASSLPPGDYRDKLIDLFFQKFQSKINVDQLIDLAVPIYDKHFSLEDLDGLTKFYQTPLGKKAVSALPQVVIETQTVSMKWGQQLGQQSMMEVLDEHPELKKSLEDAAAAASKN